MRTGNGGFKLSDKNQRNLFEIVNIFHQSPDLMLFLNQHIHVDKEFPAYSDSLLSLMENNNGVTLETKSLDSPAMQLNPNNNLVYSYQVPNLIDQMIILEALKNTKPSADAILKSFELNDKYGISLAMAQVMLTAVENEKGYLIPNLLRLNNQGKNYLKTNYLAENEGGNLISKMIEINREDVVGLVIDHDLNVLMQVDEFDKHKRNVLMIAIDKLNEGLAKLIMHKIPEDKLEEVLTQVDEYKRNAPMHAAYAGSEGLAKLIMDKIPEGKLEEVLTQVDWNGHNTLMIAIDKGSEGLAKFIIDKIPEDNLGEVLTQVDKWSCNALMIALYKGNEGLAKLIIDKTPKGKLEEVLTQVAANGCNALMIATGVENEELAKLIMGKIPEDTLEEVLTQVDKWEKNALMIALYKGNEELAKLVIDKIPKGKLEEVLTQVDMDGNNALMIASGRGIALSVLCPQGIIERLQMEL
jgi:phage shock protein A